MGEIDFDPAMGLFKKFYQHLAFHPNLYLCHPLKNIYTCKKK